MNDIKRRDQGLPYYSQSIRPALQFFWCKFWIKQINKSIPFNMPKISLILKIIGVKTGKGCIIETPFRCAIGKNTTIGDRLYSNVNLLLEDEGAITIGDDVFIGPNVCICTAGHPVHYKARNTRFEYGIPVTIGNNVWIGANVLVLPGVTIGDNTVIGGGSVVTKDIPANVVAVGNPCHVLREITDDDKQYYFKDRKFDKEFLEKFPDL